MATANGGVTTGPAPSGGQSQHYQKSQNQRRPSRACTARTPSRLAPAAPYVERPTPRKQQPQNSHRHQQRGGGGDADPPNTPMVLTSPAAPAQKQRWLLRSMWELASVIHFVNVFRPVLNLKIDFSMEELESALLTPNALLDSIHIALLKAIPPISRTPINRETWVTVLCKKLKEWWHWVAEGPFPLIPYHGEENATYKELTPDVRVIILKALCEARLDQDDMRIFIDEMLKQGAPFSSIRKERTGNDMQGTTYWYENDSVAGQRLYRELRRSDNKDKSKIRGRLVPPPTASHWETLATNLDEFQTVANKLCSSRNRMEVAIGKRINNDIVPNLKDLQKKKERALKKQQRQALLLDSYYFNTEGLPAGRPKRERKPVTYTFDDYDKSISEAIKITKRRHASPESLVAGDNKSSNGFSRQQSDEEVEVNHSEYQPVIKTASQSKLIETTSQSKLIETATRSSESDFSGDGQYGRGRRHRRPRRYVENYVDAVSENEDDASSEDDIEGEAVYDDAYMPKKKRRLAASSDGDDEYRGDEEEEEEEDEEEEEEEEEDSDEDDEDDYMGSSDEGEYVWEERYPRNIGRGRRRGKLKAVEQLQRGLRRSQRATRSHVDYSKYEESDMEEGDEYMGDTNRSERADCDRVANLANSCENIRDNDVPEAGCTAGGRQRDSNDLLEGDHDSKDFRIGEATHRTMNGIKYEPLADIKPRNKLHRFLDLNVAAPVGTGQDDSSADCSRGQNQLSPYLVAKYENSGDDGSTCDSLKALGDWPRR